MIARAIGFLKRDLHYPISVYTGDNSLFYPLDLSGAFTGCYPFQDVSFDQGGIAVVDYSGVPAPNNTLGKQYNYTYSAYWALASLQRYLQTGDVSCKQEFLRQAEWMRGRYSEWRGSVVWQAHFDWNIYGRWIRRPWVSCMDQGLVISVLARAWKLTGEKSYLELARRAIGIYSVDIEEGGFKAAFCPGDFYYEMYPVRPYSKILDGFAFALMGLYDLFSFAGDKNAKALFDRGIKTLVNNIGFWDFQGCWSRFGCFYLSTPWYHAINRSWLEIFYRLTREEVLHKTALRWDETRLAFLKRLRIKSAAYLLSRGFLFRKRIEKGITDGGYAKKS